MQSVLVFLVLLQADGEAGIVGVCKGCLLYTSPAVKAMLELEGYDAPKFSVDGNVTDFYAFTKDSFKLEGYRYHPFDFEIPMAI